MAECWRCSWATLRTRLAVSADTDLVMFGKLRKPLSWRTRTLELDVPGEGTLEGGRAGRAAGLRSAILGSEGRWPAPGSLDGILGWCHDSTPDLLLPIATTLDPRASDDLSSGLDERLRGMSGEGEGGVRTSRWWMVEYLAASKVNNWLKTGCLTD